MNRDKPAGIWSVRFRKLVKRWSGMYWVTYGTEEDFDTWVKDVKWARGLKSVYAPKIKEMLESSGKMLKLFGG